MTDMPTISVVMCVENGARYLQEALDSIALNALPDMEVLILDGDSTDDTVAIARRHALAPRILRQRAKGHPQALNQSLTEARGTWVAHIDCDDVWPAGRMRALWAAAEAGAGEWIFGQAVNCDGALRPLGAPQPARLITASLLHHSIADRIGPFRTDITHGSNIDWAARAGHAGIRFAPVDALVLQRRIHDSNMGVTGKPKAMRDLFQILRDHKARSGS
jgi:glycosyltransferase involved in cell wall biosynthesis